MKRARTPEELANKARIKSRYTLYLNQSNMEYIRDRAAKAGIGASQVVNEAIQAYIETIKKKKDS